VSGLRAGLFTVWLYGLTVLMIFAALPLFLLPRGALRVAMKGHARVIAFGLRWIVGARLRFEGLEHAPRGRALIAGKHQSMLDTIAPFLVLRDPCIPMKQELTRLPLYGWVAAKTEMITVHREAGAAALRRLVTDARDRLADGRQILIFPEGTRQEPGAPPDYKSGVAALYRELGGPCHLLATNSGACWPPHGLGKRPGTVVFEFLEPIPAGLKRAVFMRELETGWSGLGGAAYEVTAVDRTLGSSRRAKRIRGEHGG
jgi:1-acyl-sn-glycerol-3-phosphate acyltransferase